MSELTLDDYILNLRSPDPDVRRNAAWMLGRSRDYRKIEPLVAALQDGDASVRLRVAEALGNQREGTIVEPLITALQTEFEAEVRARIALSLGLQGNIQASDALASALRDSSPVVRSAAAEALGMLTDPRSVEPLVTALLHDEDEDTRYYARRALVQIRDETVTMALIAALQADTSSERKVQIIEILGGIRAAGAVETLKAFSNDPDETVAETAKWALRQLDVG